MPSRFAWPPLISLFVLIGLLAPAHSPAATPAEVDNAINRAKQFLYSRQNPNGHWDSPTPRNGAGDNDTDGGNHGGTTALAVYALLASRDNAQTPQLARAIDFLTQVGSQGMYGVGLRCSVWNLTPKSKKVNAALSRDQQIVLRSLKTQGEAAGMYHYVYAPNDTYDHSVAQYGVLGAWACTDAGGEEFPRSYWDDVDRAWRKHQYPDGSWSYIWNPDPNAQRTNTSGGNKGTPTSVGSTVSMTAAGIATLFLTRDIGRAAEGLDGKGNINDENIEKGLNWVGQHFNAALDGKFFHGGMDTKYYGLYGIERIGVASGYKYLGNVNWYQVGAEYLVRNQSGQGHWDGLGGPIANTAFGLLFLVRGRAPVLINKLQYDVTENNKPTEGHWNQRPREIASLTHWISDQTERDINWQVVNIKLPLDELQEAPVLYISGNQALAFTAPDAIAKLRQFVESGGLILGNANGASRLFADSFRKLGAILFPAYEFRELPENHPIYTNQPFPRRKWNIRPRLLGLFNGARELMVLIPDLDPARTWQLRKDAKESKDYFQLAADICLYAIDRQELPPKGNTYRLAANPAIKAERQLKIARLKYNGNWNPEPGGFQRLAALFHNDRKTDFDLQTITLGEGQLNEIPKLDPLPRPSDKELRQAAFKRIPPDQALAAVAEPAKLETLIQANLALIDAEMKAAEEHRRAGVARFKLAHLAGTTTLVLSDPQKNELKTFVNGGGTLLVEAVGGSSEFVLSLENTLSQLFGQSPALLPPDHPLYASTGSPLDSVHYRAFARTSVGSLNQPRLRAITVNNRPAILLSSEDLSAGLVGQPVDGIVGYAPDSATAIMTRIILFASK